MRATTTRMVFIVALGAGLLAGCGDPEQITVYEPGVYKGKSDPLVGKSRSTEYEEQLRERAMMVQTDR